MIAGGRAVTASMVDTTLARIDTTLVSHQSPHDFVGK